MLKEPFTSSLSVPQEKSNVPYSMKPVCDGSADRRTVGGLQVCLIERRK